MSDTVDFAPTQIYCLLSLGFYRWASKVLIPLPSMENRMLTIWISFAMWLFGWSPFLIEGPQFWAAIAKDTAIEKSLRRTAVIRLADRHARPGMTLTAFSSLFDNPNWLSKEDFTNWNEAVLGGWIPVDIDREKSTTFCFRILPELPGDIYGVYFRVSGRMDVDTLWQLFHGHKSDRYNKATILEIATSAGRDNIYWQRIKAAPPQRIPTTAP